jgi:hypothetical protein
MPVTARLLQRLHETLGDDATDDLLAWWEESLVGQAELTTLLDSRFARQNAELRGEMAAMEGRLRADMANQRADLMKWMFIFWAGTVIPLAGLMIALTRL